jgi:hypothetical protein
MYSSKVIDGTERKGRRKKEERKNMKTIINTKLISK